MVLTKAMLVAQLMKSQRLGQKEAVAWLESSFDWIKSIFVAGHSLKISGFGVFEVKKKKSRRGRNPQTGEDLQIGERRVLTFKASPVLKRMIARSSHKSSKRGH